MANLLLAYDSHPLKMDSLIRAEVINSLIAGVVGLETVDIRGDTQKPDLAVL